MTCTASWTVAVSRRHAGSAGIRMATVSLSTPALIAVTSGSAASKYSSSSSSLMSALRGGSAAALLAGKLLTVPHVGPGIGLDVGEDLLEMVPIVVNPLVEEIAHAQVADRGMLAAAPEIAGAEPADEGHAVLAQRREFVE